MNNKHTLKSQGYKYAEYGGNKEHILLNPEGLEEIWFSNKNHANYGLIYKNTHLEFCHVLGE